MKLDDVGKEMFVPIGSYYEYDDAKVKVTMGIVDRVTGHKMFLFDSGYIREQVKAIRGFMKHALHSRPK